MSTEPLSETYELWHSGCSCIPERSDTIIVTGPARLEGKLIINKVTEHFTVEAFFESRPLLGAKVLEERMCYICLNDDIVEKSIYSCCASSVCAHCSVKCSYLDFCPHCRATQFKIMPLVADGVSGKVLSVTHVTETKLRERLSLDAQYARFFMEMRFSFHPTFSLSGDWFHRFDRRHFCFVEDADDRAALRIRFLGLGPEMEPWNLCDRSKHKVIVDTKDLFVILLNKRTVVVMTGSIKRFREYAQGVNWNRRDAILRHCFWKKGFTSCSCFVKSLDPDINVDIMRDFVLLSGKLFGPLGDTYIDIYCIC